MMSSHCNRVWIAWETQRRSRTLSDQLAARLIILDYERFKCVRYPLSLMHTLYILWKYRRKVVFVQNPSMILAVFACAMKLLLKFTLIVDRHTDPFLLSAMGKFIYPQWIPIRYISNFTIRLADLTIVTNRELANIVCASRGESFILQDPYPRTERRNCHVKKVPLQIMFVASWCRDEPIEEIIQVCSSMQSEIQVYITGRVKCKYEPLIARAPSNFLCTGFLSDKKYFELMRSVDIVMVLTKDPATLVCGAYEAISVGTPLILSNTLALREYFEDVAVYASCTASDMRNKIRFLSENLTEYEVKVTKFFFRSSVQWMDKLNELAERIHAHSSIK